MSDIKVTFKRASVEASTEVGSFSELAGLIQDESSTLMKIFGDDMETVIQRLSAGVPATTTEGDTPPPPAETPAQKKKREKAAAEKAAALTATAVAPDPLPIPAQNSNDPLAIPADLVRSPNVPVGPPLAAAVPPPTIPSPPLAPPAPPLAAAAPPPPPPPVGVLGPKVVAALDALKAGNPADANGQALADWLHACGLTQKGADYNAACRVVLMTSDAKLIEAGIPTALKLAA
jgi:hypothetical protein